MIRQGSGLVPSATAALPASSPLAAAKIRVEELNVEIAEEKARSTLDQLRVEKLEAKRREAEVSRAEQDEQRRVLKQDRREREQRRQEHDRQEAVARDRRHFEDKKLRLAVSGLPQGAPEELVFDVTAAVRAELPDLYGRNDDLVDPVVIAIAKKLSRPYLRSKEAAQAAAEGLKHLTFLARSVFGQAPTEWEFRAEEAARTAMSKLPETARFCEMAGAAHQAVKAVNAAFDHSQRVCWSMIGVRSLLPGLLPYSYSREKAKAQLAVQAAFASLPAGAGSLEFDAARDTALAPFIATEAQARAEREAAAFKMRADREAEEAQAKLEREADGHLDRVTTYLMKLAADPNGWDFEGRQYECAQQIKREIRPSLIEALPLDFIAGRARVERLVDEWLANHWDSSNDA